MPVPYYTRNKSLYKNFYLKTGAGISISDTHYIQNKSLCCNPSLILHTKHVYIYRSWARSISILTLVHRTCTQPVSLRKSIHLNFANMKHHVSTSVVEHEPSCFYQCCGAWNIMFLPVLWSMKHRVSISVVELQLFGRHWAFEIPPTSNLGF